MKLDFVIFGGVGDLSLRKLLPSLYYISADGKLSAESRIICVSRAQQTHEDFLGLVKSKLKEFIGNDFAEDKWQAFKNHLSYLSLDLTASDDWVKLSDVLSLADSADDRNVIYYLSIPPTLFATACEKIQLNNLNPEYVKLVVEKPLGEDLKSAEAINNLIIRSFNEKQIYRIDHYLGKRAVQNIVDLRFENEKLDNVWNRDHIEKIEITVSEDVGVEGRAEFLDRTGILRDMMQNHLMQILNLVAMEMPDELTADDIRDEKVRVIHSLREINEVNAGRETIRAQYSAGSIGGRDVPGYQSEIKGRVAGTGETYVAIKAHIDNERWDGVAFYLKSGKRLSGRFAEVIVYFKGSDNKVLKFEIQPGVGIMNNTGIEGLISESLMTENDATRVPEAYEFLIQDVINANQTNFVRGDEIMASWKWIDGIRRAWKDTDQAMMSYKAGSEGPALD